MLQVIEGTISLLDFYKLIISILGIIGVVLSIYIGFKSQTKAIKNQWQQEFYKQKMMVYLKASETASKIAYLKQHDTTDSELLKKITLEFKTLYGGPMAILEAQDVESAMILFNEGLDSNSSNLKDLALYLSHVLRNESRASFTDEKTSTSSYGDNEMLLEKMKGLLN